MVFSRPPAYPPGIVLFRREGIAYELVQDLGLGSHGERVALALKRGKGQADLGRVIIKTLGLPALTNATKEARQRLVEEVQLATFLHHQNIARVHGLHESKGALHVITEAVSGRSLESLLNLVHGRGRYFSEPFMLHIGAQVAAALAHAHGSRDAKGKPLHIVHRAIDPTRIRVKLSGKAKLTDFGLASAHLPGRRTVRVPRARGDAYYTSPEVLLGEPEDTRSDLFVLGLMLLEFATGRHLLCPPDLLPREMVQMLSEKEKERLGDAIARAQDEWTEPDMGELVLRAATFTPEDVAQATQGLSEPVRAFFSKMLRRAPSERFASATEVENRLRKLLHERKDYGHAEAAAELHKALVDAGEALAADAEPGAGRVLHPDAVSTEPGAPGA
ncbi:serine/threonine protein kinase [Pyxidicoccus xibeiensis]|uniref:serine/threonine protein kinase n=1 Tax=Pyxidicoccus xibeiensis TaxID=2906759 RepID=UPI0020A7433E|nr:protein kinase [Pyxidicoccus xibeiensis]MCP3136894.1 protein kinase [Pyxidicoccus xibeiensis]